MAHEMNRFEEDVFARVTSAEQAALEAGRKWAKTVGEVVPVELPVLRELVKEAFALTDEVLRVQREFVHRMLQATLTAPATAKRPAGEVPATRRAAPRRTAKPRTAKVA
jgi:hypothetical protein